MTIKISVSGVSGSVGEAVVRSILKDSELTLVSASSRKLSGKNLSKALSLDSETSVQVVSTVSEALSAKPDVLIDYTHPSVVYQHCKLAIEHKTNLVIGTSGLTKEQLEELGALAMQNHVGVFAAGNFSVTAALLQHLALIAAKHLPSWEIIDYGKPKYVQVPSATGRELADKLGEIHAPEKIVPPEEALGVKEARGATVSGTQIHSIRSPGYGFSLEAVFGLSNERLVLRHDASPSPEPYVYGTLLAAKQVVKFKGLKRGIDKLLFE